MDEAIMFRLNRARSELGWALHDAANGGAPHDEEIKKLRQVIAELQRESKMTEGNEK